MNSFSPITPSHKFRCVESLIYVCSSCLENSSTHIYLFCLISIFSQSNQSNSALIFSFILQPSSASPLSCKVKCSVYYFQCRSVLFVGFWGGGFPFAIPLQIHRSAPRKGSLRSENPRWGRRPLLLVGTAGMARSFLLSSFFLGLYDSSK